MTRNSMIAFALFLCGCANQGGGGTPVNGPPSVQPAPAPTAVDSMSPLSRVPQKVREQFLKDRPDAKVGKIKGRMNPDGTVHYTITSVDKSGAPQSDEYRADGLRVGK